jgi:choline dehydrogenase-like flavoprotein
MSADILIIGAGASGAAVAWSLSEMGLKVVCLEQGDFMNPLKYPSTSRDWELRRLSDFHPSPNVRQLKTDFPVNDSESPISVSWYSAVGGSTILFSGHFPRFHPSDFKTYSLDGVGKDWPITYDQLAPFYELNDKMMGVSGIAGDPAYPPIEGLLPPIPLGRAGETIAKGFNKMGWHWWPAYSAIITRNYRNRGKCINLGPCNTGCAQGAKSSTDVTYWPEALRNGVELKTLCSVSRIATDKNGVATGAYFFDLNGSEKFQEARLVIVACNGVGTPRLLLNSRTGTNPEGLANSSGQVGKNLMLHPLGYVEGLFEEKLDSHLGPQGCCLLSQEFYETDLSRGFVRGYTMQILRGAGPVETAIAGFSRQTLPWGEGHHSSFARTFGHTVGMGIIVEDLPEEHNRVTLDPLLKDRNGIPAPKVTYKLSENSKKMLSHGMARGKEVMKAAGSVSEFGFGPVRMSGWHLMGTTRMGNDPRTSVVNNLGQCHDVRNLFIVDSSIFPTSGGVNPTSTLQSTALYIADQIKKNIKELLGTKV